MRALGCIGVIIRARVLVVLKASGERSFVRRGGGWYIAERVGREKTLSAERELILDHCFILHALFSHGGLVCDANAPQRPVSE